MVSAQIRAVFENNGFYFQSINETSFSFTHKFDTSEWSILSLNGSVVVRISSSNVNYPVWYYAPLAGTTLLSSLRSSLNLISKFVHAKSISSLPSICAALDALTSEFDSILPVSNEYADLSNHLQFSGFSANVFDEEDVFAVTFDLFDSEFSDLKINTANNHHDCAETFSNACTEILSKEDNYGPVIHDLKSNKPDWLNKYIETVRAVSQFEFSLLSQ